MTTTAPTTIDLSSFGIESSATKEWIIGHINIEIVITDAKMAEQLDLAFSDQRLVRFQSGRTTQYFIIVKRSHERKRGVWKYECQSHGAPKRKKKVRPAELP